MIHDFLPGIIGQKGFRVKPVPDRREGTVFLVIFPGPGPHGSQGAIMTICVLRIRAQIQLRGSYPIQKFRLDEFKYSLGFGLRFVFDKQEGINARLDFGFGRGENSGIYALVVEAF